MFHCMMNESERRLDSIYTIVVFSLSVSRFLKIGCFQPEPQSGRFSRTLLLSHPSDRLISTCMHATGLDENGEECLLGLAIVRWFSVVIDSGENYVLPNKLAHGKHRQSRPRFIHISLNLLINHQQIKLKQMPLYVELETLVINLSYAQFADWHSICIFVFLFMSGCILDEETSFSRTSRHSLCHTHTHAQLMIAYFSS